MEAISNITCEYNEDYTSFTLAFFFDENPYFANNVLKKTYTVSPDLLDEKSPTLTGHATSGGHIPSLQYISYRPASPLANTFST